MALVSANRQALHKGTPRTPPSKRPIDTPSVSEARRIVDEAFADLHCGATGSQRSVHSAAEATTGTPCGRTQGRGLEYSRAAMARAQRSLPLEEAEEEEEEEEAPSAGAPVPPGAAESLEEGDEGAEEEEEEAEEACAAEVAKAGPGGAVETPRADEAPAEGAEEREAVNLGGDEDAGAGSAFANGFPELTVVPSGSRMRSAAAPVPMVEAAAPGQAAVPHGVVAPAGTSTTLATAARGAVSAAKAGALFLVYTWVLLFVFARWLRSSEFAPGPV